VIGEPFVTGAFQFTTTLSFKFDVETVVGASGMKAHNNEIGSDGYP